MRFSAKTKQSKYKKGLFLREKLVCKIRYYSYTRPLCASGKTSKLKEQQFIEEKAFERKDYLESRLEKGDYELCTFSNCNFSNSDLSKIRFIECEFNDCNLSSVNLHETRFQDVIFKNCKMLALNFEKCSDFVFSIKIDNCQLCLLYTSPSPRDQRGSRMPSSA